MNSVTAYALRLGDNGLVLSQRLGAWCGHAPELEIDLALANIGLDLLGQARNFLTYAAQREGQGDEDTLAFGRDERQMLQDAINRFWWPALMMFGPNDDNSPNSARSLAWKIKRFGNDELRQRFVDNTVPQVEMLGMTVPDPDLRFDEESGHYRFGEIDWQEFDEVINGRGICNHERLAVKRKAWEEGAWVREAALAHAEKQHARKVA